MNNDTERLEWFLPILNGSNSVLAEHRTLLFAAALFRGLEGREAIDYAATLDTHKPRKEGEV